MFSRLQENRIYIISEIHPQFGGHMGTAEQMILHSKLAGADAVKVQLYRSELFGDSLREYVTIDFDELSKLKSYSDSIGIEFFASIFHADLVEWGEKLNFNYYKVASRSVDDRELCEAMIATGKPVIISLGMYDLEKELPYVSDNVSYLYCVSNYPTILEDVHLPQKFPYKGMIGYSDHTIGTSTVFLALARGARIIEKHFTLSKSNQITTELGHLGGMTPEELSDIRIFADDVVRLRS